MPARVARTPVTAWIEESSKSAASSSSIKVGCTKALSELEERWNRIQVGRQGSYSVERLESLDHYCKTTSPTRVLSVCVLTPIPALAFALLLECLPLRPPSEGLAANWMFWVRLSLMVFGLTFVGISELVLFLPNLDFTNTKRLIVSLGTTVPYVGTCVLVSSLVGFPVPFVWQYGGMTSGAYLSAMILIVFGRQPFAKGSPSRHHLRLFLNYLVAYFAMVGVYPLYEIIYEIVPTEYRGGVLIVLPLWKFAAKHFVMRATRDLEDFIPQIVAFTVDFFSALFVSVCITSAGSIYLSMLFIAADVGQSLLEFQEVRANARAVLKLLRRKHDSELTLSVSESNNLIAMLLVVTRHPKAFQIDVMTGVRLWACLPHPMTAERANKLKTLKASGSYGQRRLLSRRRTSRFRSYRQWFAPRVASIVPEVATDTKRTISTYTSKSWPIIRSDAGQTSQTFVRQGLQMLFHCEYLVLVEYVECAVPLVFGIYKSIAEHLPNIIYYPGGAGGWNLSALVNIFVFAGMEVGTLVLLHRFLQRQFAFSSLYQLAFVLEAQMYPVQATLFLEIVNLLQYKLEHLGKHKQFLHELKFILGQFLYERKGFLMLYF